jgi:hypothetical protein
MDRIIAEGFPRSGNIFFHNVLSNAFPTIEVEPFIHSVNRLNKETFVLLRDPNFSISSFMTMFDQNKESSEKWWLRFHETVLEKTDPKRWVLFEDLIADTDGVIKKIGVIINKNPVHVESDILPKNKSLNEYKKDMYFEKPTKEYNEMKEVINSL